MIRLIPNHGSQIQRAGELTFTFDGQPVRAQAGETVAVALLRARHLTLRHAPNDEAPRGLFCCMGLCQECAIIVDEAVTEGCRQIITEGLSVSSVRSKG